MIDQLEPTMSPMDVAALTGLCYQTVLAEIRAGRLRAKRVARRYLITRAAYDAWLQPEEPPWTPAAHVADAPRRTPPERSTRAPRAGTVAALKALEAGGAR